MCVRVRVCRSFPRVGVFWLRRYKLFAISATLALELCLGPGVGWGGSALGSAEWKPPHLGV